MKIYNFMNIIFKWCYREASAGKGFKRHGSNVPFQHQITYTIMNSQGVGFALGQAMKKLDESKRLPKKKKIKELIGAINYIVFAIFFIIREGK